MGTFFNSSTKRCQSCSLGEYQNVSGSLNCKRCPEYTSTKKMHSKSLQDCIRKYFINKSFSQYQFTFIIRFLHFYKNYFSIKVIFVYMFLFRLMQIRILFSKEALSEHTISSRTLPNVRHWILSTRIWSNSLSFVST